ncbi:pimeloyl-ACP methyl ester carboxylesterase [Hamadaea flava]|uniref:Alpha/beta fold hydrolase n=1 Tax=Hamadaea flava TaxID=1742688 RepID=A0ABV8LSV4_9ACTN|nr:alpha/beta hydrolase [Hamadaea flava]MCP2321885.1 pimeloyl-ACP methyl ester carboxylesterase [Hamadaea flava]
MKFDVRGMTFDADVDGPEDGPVVLLLHGFPQHKGEWDLVTPTLRDAGLRTVAFDQRGYAPGARPAAVEAYQISEIAADALAVLDKLGVGAAHVVGHDWGAAIGWYLAARHPERTRTLTALSVPHVAAFGRAIRHDDDQRERSSYMDFFRTPEAEDVLLEDDGLRIRAMFLGCPEGRIDRYVTPMLHRERLTGGLNWYRAMGHGDFGRLGPVAVPTTFLWSNGDLAIGRAAAEACVHHVTGEYAFVELDEVSHWIPDAVPERVAAEILKRAA